MNENRRFAVTSIYVVIGIFIILSFVTFPSGTVFGQNKDPPLNDTKKNNIESGNATQGWNVPNLVIDHATGGFSGVQAENDNKTWITSGKWDFISRPSAANASDWSYVSFNGSIDMRTTNNSEGHAVKVSDFRFTKGTIVSADKGSVLTISGTATIKMPSGENDNIPITIKIIDEGPIFIMTDAQTDKAEPKWIPKGGTISLLINNPKIAEHFGSSPIYGTVRRE